MRYSGIGTESNKQKEYKLSGMCSSPSLTLHSLCGLCFTGTIQQCNFVVVVPLHSILVKVNSDSSPFLVLKDTTGLGTNMVS